ncbi:uncharacterized protein [Nicotiana tomentosiformis]|uniref:uncharacterized protein n=1 Tax=Nicotiana tomentosiformis TaxID=4098 RepID=UPI00388CC9A0
MVRTRTTDIPDLGGAAPPVAKGRGRGRGRAPARGRGQGHPRAAPVAPPANPVEDPIIEELGEVPLPDPAPMDFMTALGFQEREELWCQLEQLEQGQMSVTDYEAIFSELSRHALMILPTDAERVQRFVAGLHPSIRASMAREVEMGTDYQLVVEISRRIEGYRQRGREQMQQDKRTRFLGEFRGAPARGRGSTYLYVLSMFAHFLDIPRESLGPLVYVSTSVGDSVVVNHIYRSCVVTFCGYETIADLLLLNMIDFEVILGMDWLSPYHAILDCYAMTVTLAMPELPILDWKGSSVSSSSQVISFLKGRHLVKKGCLAYLAYVRGTTAESPMIDSVPVVREFADVFPSDLPGMPPDCDIDFRIDLAPGTQPISIPSYRMAPKELKEQL